MSKMNKFLAATILSAASVSAFATNQTPPCNKCDANGNPITTTANAGADVDVNTSLKAQQELNAKLQAELKAQQELNANLQNKQQQGQGQTQKAEGGKGGKGGAGGAGGSAVSTAEGGKATGGKATADVKNANDVKNSVDASSGVGPITIGGDNIEAVKIPKFTSHLGINIGNAFTTKGNLVQAIGDCQTVTQKESTNIAGIYAHDEGGTVTSDQECVEKRRKFEADQLAEDRKHNATTNLLANPRTAAVGVLTLAGQYDEVGDAVVTQREYADECRKQGKAPSTDVGDILNGTCIVVPAAKTADADVVTFKGEKAAETKRAFAGSAHKGSDKPAANVNKCVASGPVGQEKQTLIGAAKKQGLTCTAQ